MTLRSHLRCRASVTAAAVTLVIAGVAVAQARPALADPTDVYVAVGSDTTQDVMDQYAVDLAGNELGSYDAVNPVTQATHEIITPVNKAGGDCSLTRPNGSNEGLAALRKSINQSTTATQLAAPPQANCIDIGRVANSPGTNQSNTGALVYIPFALDAVGGSIGPAGTTQITTANSFTITDLINLYKNCTNVTEGGVTYNPNTAAAGQTQINLYVPQPGAGTRSFWAAALGFSATTLPSCVHDHIVAGPDATQAVEQNDGTAVSTDSNGFVPFSIAQWISQRNGHADRRHGTVVTSINGVSPFGNGNASTGSLNSNYPITREVYNVVPFAKVSGSSADPGLGGLLVGTSSALCQDQLTLASYGFAPLGPATTDQCGSIANSLRAFDPATNPV